jgi:hypothetical protein
VIVPFEIEFNFRKNEDALWLILFAALIIAALIGLTQMGRSMTPMDTGAPRLLEWSDWRLLQAKRAHSKELSTLRKDAMQLADALNQKPNPVATQFLVEGIIRHTQTGGDSLTSARLALEKAALNVRDWSTGTLERDTAIKSVQDAVVLLQQ